MAGMLTDDQFQQWLQMQREMEQARVQAMVQQATQALPADAGSATSGARWSGSRPTLDVRNCKMGAFSGKVEDWADWCFGFKGMIRASSWEMYDALEKVLAEPSFPPPAPVAMPEAAAPPAAAVFPPPASME